MKVRKLKSFQKKSEFVLDTLLACGDWDTEHSNCEIYKINQDRWQTITPYPFVLGSGDFLFFNNSHLIPTKASFIAYAPVVYHRSAFYTGIGNLKVLSYSFTF